MFHSSNSPPRVTERGLTARGPKIIVQYRAKGAKIYEIQSDGIVVAVRICQEEPGTAAEEGWHVDAKSASSGGGASFIEGRGATAAEALNEVARAWNAHSPALTGFDWEAIARELHGVRAL
jgi:hypothetical protein